MKNFKAFTLAETLTVLIVIGIIISISMPMIIQKHTESVKRVKIKKAMAMYDSAIHAMYDGQGFLTKQAFLNWAKSEPDCANTKVYFKRAEAMQFHGSEEKSGCVFKTVDGVWWDITNIDNPIIMLNEGLLSCLNGTYQACQDEDKSCCSRNTLLEVSKNPIDTDTNVFTMSFQVDEETGMLHVNDKNYEEGFLDNYNNRAYMTKLFSFIYDKKFTSEVHVTPDDSGDSGDNGDDNNEENNTPDNLCVLNSNPCDGINGDVTACTKDGQDVQVSCSNGKLTNSQTTPLIVNCNDEKMAFVMSNGVINEVQYLEKDNKPVEGYQYKGKNNTRIIKYNYDGDTFKQAWWYRPDEGFKDYTYMALQYEYNGTYYYIEMYNSNIILACSSDKSFYLKSSQNYDTTGTQSCSKLNKSVSSIKSQNSDLGKAVADAYNAGYFTKPSGAYTLSDKLSTDFSAYYQCVN